MQATIKKEDRAYITMAEGDKLPTINRMIKDEDLIENCKLAMSVLGIHPDSCNTQIMKTDASLGHNCDADDAYFAGSNSLDVWIECWVFEENVRFVHFSIYLTDIWKISADNKSEIRKHMFVDEYILKGGKQ